jgi:hypothetical protein
MIVLIWLVIIASRGSHTIQQDDQKGRDQCVLTNTCRTSSP